MPRTLPALLLYALLTDAAYAEPASQIVFTSTREGRSDPVLHLMDADGKHVRRLGTLEGRQSRPQFSQDNQKVAFTYTAAPNEPSQVYVIDVADGTASALTKGPDAHGVYAVTAEGRIAYFRKEPGRMDRQLRIMDFDGGNDAAFAHAAATSGATRVAPAPQGGFTFRKTVAGLDLQPYSQLFTVDAQGTVTQLTSGSHDVADPSWCSDGSKLAYANSGRDAGFDRTADHTPDGLYVRQADGKEERVALLDFSRQVRTNAKVPLAIVPVRLTAPPSFDAACETLAYSVLVDTLPQIFSVRTSGKDLRQLTQGPGGNHDPAFSH